MELGAASLSMPFITRIMEEQVFYYASVCLTVGPEPVGEKRKHINSLVLNPCIVKRLQVKFTDLLHWKHSDLIGVYNPSSYQSHIHRHTHKQCMYLHTQQMRGYCLGMGHFVTLCLDMCFVSHSVTNPPKSWLLIDVMSLPSLENSKAIFGTVRQFI